MSRIESAPCRGCGTPIQRTNRTAPIRHYCTDDCRPRCSVAACTSAVKSKGMCGRHATRALAHGDPAMPLIRKQHKGLLCAVEGCGQPRRKRDWCAAHYAQWQHYGEVRPFGYKWATERRCLTCGCEHDAIGSRRFCSSKCKALFHNHQGQRPQAVPCVGCGQRIDLLRDLTKAGHRRKSDVKLCRRCRQDKRKHGVSVEWLAQRDGNSCGICGEMVDLTLRAPERMRASVDHVIPRARGGTNDTDNLQLAHLWCNQVKSDRVA